MPKEHQIDKLAALLQAYIDLSDIERAIFDLAYQKHMKRVAKVAINSNGR